MRLTRALPLCISIRNVSGRVCLSECGRLEFIAATLVSQNKQAATENLAVAAAAMRIANAFDERRPAGRGGKRVICAL